MIFFNSGANGVPDAADNNNLANETFCPDVNSDDAAIGGAIQKVPQKVYPNMLFSALVRGGKLYVPKIVGLSIFRELGPVLTCLMLAGRVGSGIAAEIGSMKVTQQIDAIRALGTDPLKKIVIPRVLAMLLMAPLLTTLADLLGVFGGMYLSHMELNIHPSFYYQNAIIALRTTDFVVGVAKTG